MTDKTITTPKDAQTNLSHIVALATFRDRLFVATPDTVFDISEKSNPVRVFDLEAARVMESGREYKMEEIHK